MHANGKSCISDPLPYGRDLKVVWTQFLAVKSCIQLKPESNSCISSTLYITSLLNLSPFNFFFRSLSLLFVVLLSPILYSRTCDPTRSLTHWLAADHSLTPCPQGPSSPSLTPTTLTHVPWGLVPHGLWSSFYEEMLSNREYGLRASKV